MRTPPRAKRCHAILDEIVEILEYYMPESTELTRIKTVDIKYLRDYISEISEEKKLTEIKLAAKMKAKEKGNSE